LPTLDAPVQPPAAPAEAPKERESSVILAMQRASARREHSWMSNAPHTPRPAAPSDAPDPAAPEVTTPALEADGDPPVLAPPRRSAPPDPDYEPELLVSDHVGETSAEVESWEALERELEEPADEPSAAAARSESTAAESRAAALGVEPTLLDLDRLLAEQDVPAQPDGPMLSTSLASPEEVLVPEVRLPEAAEQGREPETAAATPEAEEPRGAPLPISVPEPLPPFPPSRSLPARDGRVRRSRARGRSGESATREAAGRAPKAQPRSAERAQPRAPTTPSRVAALETEPPLRAAGAARAHRPEPFEAPLARTSAAIRILEDPAPALPASAAHPQAEPADAVPELPESAVLPVAERAQEAEPGSSAAKSAWKDLLDVDGTASGW
jgi:hypothetical protein